MQSKGAQIAVGAVLILALLGWFGWTSLEGAGSYAYYQSLEELRAAGPEAAREQLRVHGYVALESIERDLPGRQVLFDVQNDPPHAGGPVGETLAVVYRSLETPDLFKDGAEVVVEGRLERQGQGTVLVAENVMAKCPSKFEAKAAAGEAPPI